MSRSRDTSPTRSSSASEHSNSNWKRSSKKPQQQPPSQFPEALLEAWIVKFRRLPVETRFYSVPVDLSPNLACKLLASDPLVSNYVAIYCQEQTRDQNQENLSGPSNAGNAECSGIALFVPSGIACYFDFEKLGGVPIDLVSLLSNENFIFIGHNLNTKLRNIDQFQGVKFDLYTMFSNFKEFKALPQSLQVDEIELTKFASDLLVTNSETILNILCCDEAISSCFKAATIFDTFALVQRHSQSVNEFAAKYQQNHGTLPYPLLESLWVQSINAKVDLPMTLKQEQGLSTNSSANQMINCSLLSNQHQVQQRRPIHQEIQAPIPQQANNCSSQQGSTCHQFHQAPNQPPNNHNNNGSDVEKRFAALLGEMIKEFHARFYNCISCTWMPFYEDFFRDWKEKLHTWFHLPEGEMRSKEFRMRKAIWLRINNKAMKSRPENPSPGVSPYHRR